MFNHCLVGFDSFWCSLAVAVHAGDLPCVYILTAFHGYFFSSPQAHVAAVTHFPPWACWKQEYVSSQTTLRNQSLVPSRLCLAASILRVSMLVYTNITFTNDHVAEGNCMLKTSMFSPSPTI